MLEMKFKQNLNLSPQLKSWKYPLTCHLSIRYALYIDQCIAWMYLQERAVEFSEWFCLYINVLFSVKYN